MAEVALRAKTGIAISIRIYAFLRLCLFAPCYAPRLK